VDGEEVNDLALLAEALSVAEGRDALLDFVRVRAAVRADRSRPGAAFYEQVRPMLEAPSGRSAPRVLRRIAAAIVLALATAGLVDFGWRLHEGSPAEQPPPTTRVLRFEPGVDWHVSVR
jgi:hypothetical protein